MSERSDAASNCLHPAKKCRFDLNAANKRPFSGRFQKGCPVGFGVGFENLANPQSLGFVVLGTLVGTLLRCGPANIRTTCAAMRRAAQSKFDREQTRALLAYHAACITRDGVLRASDRSSSDPDIDECLAQLVRQRSIAAMEAMARSKHALKETKQNAAIKTLESAAELAPVFGLAGTLLALSQLPSGGGVGADGLMPTVATAVQTTLFGLVLGNLLFVPLARWLDRAMDRELIERRELLDWFIGQIEYALPSSAPPQPVRKPGSLTPANQANSGEIAA